MPTFSGKYQFGKILLHPCSPKREWHGTGEKLVGGWSDDSVIKSTSCFSRGSRFDSHSPYDVSHASVPSILEDPISGLCKYQTCKWNTDTRTGKASMCIK